MVERLYQCQKIRKIRHVNHDICWRWYLMTLKEVFPFISSSIMKQLMQHDLVPVSNKLISRRVLFVLFQNMTQVGSSSTNRYQRKHLNKFLAKFPGKHAFHICFLKACNITKTTRFWTVTFDNNNSVKVHNHRSTFSGKVQKSVIFRSGRPEVFCEKGVLRNFAKFTGKHLCQCLFFNKVAGLRLLLLS